MSNKEQTTSNKQRATNNEQGFTLLEVMVAMAILSVGFVSVLGVFSSGLKSARLSESYTLATILARQKMEEVIGQQNIEAGSSSGEFEGDYSFYSWEVNIEPYEFQDEDAEEEPKYGNDLIVMFKISTKVSWEDGKKKRDVDLVTLKMALEKESI